MTQSNNIDIAGLFSIKSIVLKLVGVAFAFIAFKGFMIPNRFLDGGINGISILLHELLHIPISVPIILLNIPFLIMGYHKIGKNFAAHSSLSILLLALALFVLEIPAVTTDRFLIAMFGGLFIGLAIGFVIRSGGVIDGLEVIAEHTHNNSVFTASEIIMTINTVVFISAGFFFGMETAMYSIITFFTALKTSNYVVDGFEEYTAMTIVSKEHEKIKKLIVLDFDKAISVYKGERGYLPQSFEEHSDCDIIVTIITRLEIFHLKQAIIEVDPQAFIHIHSINEVKGGVIKNLRTH